MSNRNHKRNESNVWVAFGFITMAMVMLVMAGAVPPDVQGSIVIPALLFLCLGVLILCDNSH